MRAHDHNHTYTQPTFASLLSHGPADPDAHREIWRFLRHALWPIAIAGTLLAAWTFAAPLSGAIIAAGKLKVELNHKTVQHKEGGIVRSILVREGDLVRAGQPLIVIGDVRNDSELSLLVDQLDSERIRNARATAEAALAVTFDAPARDSGTPQAREHLARETALFDARRRTLDEYIASLEAQLRESQAEADALAKQIQATQLAAALATEEREINEELALEGFVQRARLLQLQRDEADYVSRMSEAQSDLATARQRAGEVQTRVAQARNQYQQVATDEAKASAARIREIEERLRPFRDQANRQYVRAPVDGKVMGVRVSAPGEVIGAGDPILDIVPTQEKLVVEAHIRPQDIQHVYEGAPADVRLTAFDARTTPLLPAMVTLVSADRYTAPDNGASWYAATVEIDAAALAEHPQVRLRAGMPAELFVATPERSLFQYLAQPLNAFASRAMREP